jgi:DNA polymerase bacteriophage-type
LKAFTLRLVLDLETSSTADLRLTGAQAYAAHPETRVTVLAFAVDDEAVQIWTGGPIPARFVAAVRAGSVVVAHNYLFEYNIYHEKLVPSGWPTIPLAQWSCTMARAYVAGYPGSLELAGKAAKIAIPKDAGGRDLMLRMARPRTTTPAITWWHETSPEHFKRLCDYCVTDVEAERLLDRVLPELSPREREVFDVDFHINQRGLHIDLQLVMRLRELAEDAKGHLTSRLIRVTNGQVTTANQVAKLRAWLAFHGLETADLRRATVRGLLDDPAVTGPVRTVLQARFDASRSSTAKLDAILHARSPDGRVRGCFQFYGANRTGRWAGRRIQPQNLYRGSIKNVPAALTTIMCPHTTPADLETLFEDSAMGIIASCLRSTIVARPGHKLVIIDLSQIEARVLAWLAGERASLDCFRRGDDIYTETARRVGSASRQLGKVLVLACGFGMGAVKFQATAAGYGVALDLMECERLVALWRESNPAIVSYWWECERAMHRACESAPGTVVQARGGVAFIRQSKAVLIQLPSGRHLVYRQPSIQWNPDNRKNQFTYMGSGGGGWMLQRAWPGKIVENIVQAVARDVLAEHMIELHRLGVPLIATVHDELVAEVPEAMADHTFSTMQLVMSGAPAWGWTMPMGAAGFIADRYHKK